jgi:hypothetical protein
MEHHSRCHIRLQDRYRWRRQVSFRRGELVRLRARTRAETYTGSLRLSSHAEREERHQYRNTLSVGTSKRGRTSCRADECRAKEAGQPGRARSQSPRLARLTDKEREQDDPPVRYKRKSQGREGRSARMLTMIQSWLYTPKRLSLAMSDQASEPKYKGEESERVDGGTEMGS